MPQSERTFEEQIDTVMLWGWQYEEGYSGKEGSTEEDANESIADLRDAYECRERLEANLVACERTHTLDDCEERAKQGCLKVLRRALGRKKGD